MPSGVSMDLSHGHRQSLRKFIRKAESLASEYKVVESKVYSVATTNVIRCCIPFRYREMLNESLGDLNVPEQEKIKEFLSKKKIAAQQECQLQEGEAGSQKTSRPVGNKSNNIGRDNDRSQPSAGQYPQQQTQGHNC